jgi:hypothetical protein
MRSPQRLDWKIPPICGILAATYSMIVFACPLAFSSAAGNQTTHHAAVPYTVTLQQSHSEPGHETANGVTITWAVRSDGARANRIVMNAGKPLIERMLDFPSGEKMTIMELTHRKSTTFDSERAGAPWLRFQDQNCVLPGGAQPESLDGFESVEGYRTARITKGPAKFWYALDYGCAPVRDSISWGASGANETRLVKLTLGEPSAELFADPPDYEELPPSGLFGALTGQTKLGDAYYNAHRPH